VTTWRTSRNGVAKPAPPGSARMRAAVMSAAAIERKAPMRNERGSCYTAAAAPIGSSGFRKMYQSTFSIASSEIRPTAWLRRCIVTYASITKPEKSRNRRIIPMRRGARESAAIPPAGASTGPCKARMSGSYQTRRWREMDSNHQYPEEKLPAIDRHLAVASAGERGTWRSELGKDGPKCRMPTTTNGLGPRLRDSQDRKRELRRARCGFLACWQSRCSRPVGSFASIR
jgi:hypothetical protein